MDGGKGCPLPIIGTAMSTANEVFRRRTFAIISHPDAGKTTLTEKLLLYAGAIHIAGSVKARKASRYATSDWMEIEKQRGISVASSVMQMEYRDCVINLLDTPGHKDFSEDTYRVLTAVDAALMVIDAANGIEAQTLRLLEVCRAQATPVITFVNKMDREVREPLDLVDEIERTLEMPVVPCTWPVGMGKSFKGVFDLSSDTMRVFRPGADRVGSEDEIIAGLDNPQASARFGDIFAHARQDMALVKGVSPAYDREAFLAGKQTPLFFGSAINNFGVREVLDALVEFAPPPRPRKAIERLVDPMEPKFSGVVFKIQANMDPGHRDRIAFIRVCSGHFERGMRLTNCRTGKDFRPDERGLVPVAAPRAGRGRLRGRHHRHPQPRRAAAGRYADRGRRPPVHRAALLRAGAVPDGRDRRPAAQQATADRARAARGGRRDTGVPAGGGRRRCSWARSATSSSTSSRTGCATSTDASRASCPRATRWRAG